MDPTEPTDPFAGLSPESKVAAVFREAGFEVEQRVGAEPGTVDWFAVPKTGFLRPRTYFATLLQPPEELESALAALDTRREATGADRAIGIVMEGSLPEGYEPDVVRRASNLLTFRRWFLEVAGLAEEARELVRSVEQAGEHDLYLPRRARLKSGEEVQVEPFLDAWAQADEGPTVWIVGTPASGKSTVLRLAAYRAAQRFAAHPETTPLLSSSTTPLARHAMLLGLVISAGDASEPPLPRQVRRLRRTRRWNSRLPWDKDDDERQPSDVVELRLLAPEPDEIDRWFDQHLLSTGTAKLMRRARRSSDEFAAISSEVPHLRHMLGALRSQPQFGFVPSLDGWIASVMAGYFLQLELEGLQKVWTVVLEEAALTQFDPGHGWERPVLGLTNDWPKIADRYAWVDAKARQIVNSLVRDYFLARKIAREVQEGREEILLRHQFPRFVYLYLSLLAPDVAARMTGGAVERMEQKIQEEVERKLHLTFAHHLNRPVGAMRQCVGDLREELDPKERAAVERSLSRLEEEIEYLANLAERTRLWQDEPTGTCVSVVVRSLAEEILTPLRQRYPAVTAKLDTPGDLQVSALPEALREALHCIFENAFHAAVAAVGQASPGVTVRAYRLGESVRIEVRDSGGGVDQGDRERIFEPLVTTKTGGAGKPRGTGLGLAIARHYVECMGGRVGIDPDQQETCFCVDLVAWRDEA